MAYEKHKAAAGRLVRRLLLSPLGYRATGITRTDVQYHTALAQQVQQQLGTVPADVLERRTRPQFGPLLPPPSPPTRSSTGQRPQRW